MIPRRDLRVHEAGVALIRNVFPNFQDTKDRFKRTHFDPTLGVFVRQKTDLYPFVNVFLEEYSNWRRHTIGGPFQAYADGCGDYMYYFPRSGKIIRTVLNDTTIQITRDLIQKYRFNKNSVRIIPNAGYLTKGYIIPVWEYINWFGNQCKLLEVAAYQV